MCKKRWRLMRLYHGSYCRITNIDLGKSRDYKDFGKGFYLTPDFSRAVTMANRSVVLNQSGSPQVNPYIFNKTSCSPELKIKEFKSCNWEWTKFVMLNRDKSLMSPYRHGYDIVIGPVADSSVDPEIEDYKREYEDDYLLPENLKILAKRLKYPGNYIQYCFCTEKAIKHLIYD